MKTTRELVRGLAHEIKTPGGIRGAAQLLERALAAPELSEYTQIIIEEADRSDPSWIACSDLTRPQGPSH